MSSWIIQDVLSFDDNIIFVNNRKYGSKFIIDAIMNFAYHSKKKILFVTDDIKYFNDEIRSWSTFHNKFCGSLISIKKMSSDMINSNVVDTFDSKNFDNFDVIIFDDLTNFVPFNSKNEITSKTINNIKSLESDKSRPTFIFLNNFDYDQYLISEIFNDVDTLINVRRNDNLLEIEFIKSNFISTNTTLFVEWIKMDSGINIIGNIIDI